MTVSDAEISLSWRHGIVCGHKFMMLEYDDVSKSGFNAKREYVHKRLALHDTTLFVKRTGSERGFAKLYAREG